MAHYAVIDENNIVTQVIVGKDENEGEIDWEQHYGNFFGKICKRTSYNTLGGEHKNGGTPFRKNYAGVGYTYDEERDAFIPPKEFDSWILDENTCWWKPPVEMPEERPDGYYTWDEENVNWVFTQFTYEPMNEEESGDLPSVTFDPLT